MATISPADITPRVAARTAQTQPIVDAFNAQLKVEDAKEAPTTSFLRGQEQAQTVVKGQQDIDINKQTMEENDLKIEQRKRDALVKEIEDKQKLEELGLSYIAEQIGAA